nr:MAG: 4-(cytidine 5'-diphospho)-2-C-methyl-D-erythritol kinase [Hyphomicrobiales bacterium]
MMRVLAPAKLNLFLHVGEKRADRYHALESLVVFADLCDVLTFERADCLSLQITGPFSGALTVGPDNLVLRAADALRAGQGARITLEKNLPVASGIGGGSADAGAVLRGLNMFWNLKHDVVALNQIASSIGSDVPVCLLSQSAWVAGRGEIVHRLMNIAPFELVLVNPNVPLATKEIFARLNVRSGLGAISPPANEIKSVWDLVGYLADFGNDLEAPACALAPVIDEVLEALAHEPGCVLAQMSGSGATCFGIFQESAWADGAAERIERDHDDWWVRRSRLASADIGDPKNE